MEYLELAYALIVVGVIFLVAEVFLPTGGICFLFAAMAFLAGILLAFTYGDRQTGVVTLIGVFVLVPIGLSAMFSLWPAGYWGSKLDPDTQEDYTVATMPGNLRNDDLKNRVGKAVSPLRPAGVVSFEGRRVDCITEGMMVEAGMYVRCVAVKAGKVVVRPIDTPSVESFETADFS